MSSPSAAPSERVELSLAGQRRMVEQLQSVLAAGGPVETVHWHETHISHVLVDAHHAYKIKKALATSFLDQSTLARRQEACEDELRLNRRWAPTLYEAVVPVTGAVEDPRVDGVGPVLDFAVRMQAFRPQALWDGLAAAGELGPADVDALAANLARWHRDAPVAHPPCASGTPLAVRRPVLDVLADLQRRNWAPGVHASVAALVAWEARQFRRLERRLWRRLEDGFVREVHGDLHLANVARIDGDALAFDGIEFSPALRWIDVMSDIAFLAMDLHAHGLTHLAARFVDRVLSASGDYDGMAVLRYYAVYRALVRAQVAWLRAMQSDAPDAHAAARRYVRAAEDWTLGGRATLIVTHGLSGSGKTTWTDGLLEAAGALRVRSDVERKRLAGLVSTARVGAATGAGLYDASFSDATYARLLQAAAAAIDDGWPVILDAAFLRREQRDLARQWAAARGVPFTILAFDAPAARLEERLRRRSAAGSDASDADVAVLRWQQQHVDPVADDEADAVFRIRTDVDGARPDLYAIRAWIDRSTRARAPAPG